MSPRATAAAEGRKTYDSGSPCKKGHAAERYTNSAHCVECLRIKNKIVPAEWRKRNPERAKALARKFYEADPGYSVRNRRKNWDRVYAARLADPQRRLANNLRAAICGQIRHGAAKKVTATTDLLGCSIEEFKAHIERQWRPGMSWSNWGRHRNNWQLDHIRPVASFDLTCPAQQAACFHWSNYQPLWQAENAAKGARWEA